MITRDGAFEALRAANPAPLVAEVSAPSAEEVLAAAREAEEITPLRQIDPQPAWRTRGPLVAALAFAAVVVAGFVAMLLLGEPSQVIEEPVPPSIPLVPTTSTPESPTTSNPGETSSDVVPPEQLAVLDDFAVAYSSGDFAALLNAAPGLSFDWQRASDAATPWTDEELRARFEIDAALDTRISFDDCQVLVADRVSCVVLREDDLVRAIGIEPPRDVRWRLEIQDGAVSAIEELTPDAPRYYHEARKPFQQWLRDVHPEVENPGQGLEGTPWRTDTDFAEVAAELVAEWAATLGE